MHRSRVILRSLHAHEIMMGMLTQTGHNRMTGASVALRVLVGARQDGLSDAEILARSPIVLALTPPRVAPAPVLPEACSALPLGSDEDNANDNGILREALRLRVRWMQELSGRAAWELGERLTATGQLTEPELIRHMTIEHVEAVATKRAVVIPALITTHRHEFGEPLPSSFQLSDIGRVVRVRMSDEVGGGTGAGGGVASWTGHLRHREPAGRVGARHHDPAARARATAPPAQGRGRGNRLGAVASRHPRPRSARRDRRRLRGRDGRPAAKERSCASTARPAKSTSRRRKPDEDHRLGRWSRDPRLGRGAT